MLSFTPYLPVSACSATITITNGTSVATEAQRPLEKYAMATAATTKIHGAALVMAAP
jgi:hypothetical protein